MKFSTVVVSAALGVSSFTGLSALFDDGIKGCVPDGDGGAYIIFDDPNKAPKQSNVWKVSDDGENCLASNGGSVAPESIPVLKDSALRL